MLGAINAAKAAIGSMTGQQVDAIVQCTRADDGDWTVAIDVIESFARMGDNDLLTTYAVQINAHADLVNFNRLRRYHREDQEN
ncbi:gas vesicle protein GvpO [Yoonia maricola]|uniref:Gas vesicle protein GvpO n=2 Tax=Yoonia maricola TaxID=420999 RepID=A0A2M8WKI2_9RHOB|nr:gas vesicle protein GvpO [Yoonia maricola]